MMRRASHLLLRAAAGAGCGVVVAVLTLTAWFAWAGPPPSVKNIAYGTVVLDQEGRLLRPYTTADGRWRLKTRLADVDPRYVRMLLAYEDKRFRKHHGVDPLALSRAAWQLATHGRIVSGASTITMQVVRLLAHDSERSLGAKLREMAWAVRLERSLSKDDILALYLNLAPYGGNLEGVRAASLAYFGKEPRRLSPGEAALLVALPQSPETRRPDRAPLRARAARTRVLDRIVQDGLLPADEVRQAKAERMPNGRRPMPALAAIAADEAVVGNKARTVHHLTIDAPLQAALERLAHDRAPVFGAHASVAIIAIDHATGRVLARVASADYFDPRRAGQVDMTQALRSPGSTLKPFIYGVGFEDGLIHPDTLIEDRPIRFGSYAPKNFDLSFQGTVSIRKALQLSLNVPAVAVLDRVGANRLAARVNQAGGRLVLPPGEAPGLAMGLGGVGIRLSDLTMLYAGIARGGMAMPLLEDADDVADRAPQRLLDPVAAWYVGNILMGTPPPDNAPRNRIAYKTGTSYGYRDAWAVGFDGEYTIGVWVGRPDGAPIPGLVGRGAAAPILFDAFARSGKVMKPLAPPPSGAILVAAKLPPPLQHFASDMTATSGVRGIQIMFPPNGARLELSGDGGGENPVPLKVTGGARPFTLFVNGAPVAARGAARGRNTLFFQPKGPGFARLTVLDAKGTSDSVVVRLQ